VPVAEASVDSAEVMLLVMVDRMLLEASELVVVDDILTAVVSVGVVDAVAVYTIAVCEVGKYLRT
jgi:hypothetical protein